MALRLLIIFLASLPPLAQADNEVSQEKLKVGLSLPLTEGLAEMGEALQNGIKLAQEESGPELSKIDFLYEDDSYQPKKAIAGIESLRARFGMLPQVFFIWGNEPALGVASVVDRYKLLTFATAQHPDVTKGHPWVIGFINPARDYQEPIARYILSKGYKKVTMVKAQASWFEILHKELKEQLGDKVKIDVISEPLFSDLDFRSTIINLKRNPPEVLALYILTSQLLAFAKQANEYHFSAPIIGGTQTEGSELRKSQKSFYEGTIFSQLHVDPAFHARYIQRFGHDNIISYAANAYDFVKLIGRISHEDSRKPILDRFLAQNGYEGACGKMRIQESQEEGRRALFQVVLKQVRNGEIVEIAQ